MDRRDGMRLLATAVAVLLAGALEDASAGDDVTYGLLEGSTITDTCLACNRIPIVRSIEGTFVLTLDEAIPGATRYLVSDVDLMSPGGKYVASGEGKYSVIITAPPFQQEMALDLEINGAKGVALASERLPIEADSPVIEIEVTEDGTRDPAHLYILHIVAAPLPKEWVRYMLVKESFFVDDCTICGKPTVPVPIDGAFLLGEIDSGANPFVTYIVRDLYARPRENPNEYRITGGGIYRQGGEVALTQEISLRLRVNDVEGAILEGGPDSVPNPLPDIEIDARHTNPTTPMHVYSLHIVAIPNDLPDMLFRRGDANVDGRRDVADAVYTLSHMFCDGPAPCQDAMDVNDDGVLDLADPIWLLSYLFIDGAPAPDPPLDCGSDPTRSDTLECFMSPGC
ncbi:MAG: hypothetical protein JXP34_07950 [Planctomycetes bacterium]|nr:hypothetical protein [Planctomycetota bacterium]